MIPAHVMRETSFIQSIENEAREKALHEGREEGREIVVEMLLHAIGNHFPKLDFVSEIERIRDIEALKQLFFDLDRVSDEGSLRQRITELSPRSQS
jgi:predicted transposase YdaD